MYFRTQVAKPVEWDSYNLIPTKNPTKLKPNSPLHRLTQLETTSPLTETPLLIPPNLDYPIKTPFSL